MKTAYTLPAVLIAVVLAIGVVCVSPVFSDEKVSLDQVPAAVRATIEAQAGQGTIAEIEKETEDGRVLYDAEIIMDGKETEVVVSPTGALVENDDDDGDDNDDDDDGDAEEDEDEGAVLLKDTPQAVQDALARLLPGVQIDRLTLETEHGVEVYEVSYEAAGTEHSIELTDQGYVLESEEEIASSELPAAVTSAIADAFADAEIEEAEVVQQTVYEVELKAGGKKHELVLLANGHIIDTQEH